MANTPRGYPYPAATDSPAGHTQIQSLATAIDTDVGGIATNVTSLLSKQSKYYPRITPNAAPGSPGMGGSQTLTVASLAIPDPGWAYYVETGATLLVSIFGGANTSLREVYLQLNLDEASFVPSPTTRIIQRSASAENRMPQIIQATRSFYRTTLTGSHTIYLIIRNESVPSNFLTWADNEYYTFDVAVHPA
jgi:hypothetical protein